MKLWLIEIGNYDHGYDIGNAFVVRAVDENEARELASTFFTTDDPQIWLDPDRSTCVPVPVDGPACVILGDFNAG